VGAWRAGHAGVALVKKSHDNDLRDYWRFRAARCEFASTVRQPKYRPRHDKACRVNSTQNGYASF